MWFIFPQLAGLGQSATAQFYGIRSATEAKAFLNHSVLGPQYIACVKALQDLPGRDPAVVFGAIDAMKLRSSLTLFESVGQHQLLGAALGRWFAGERDTATLRLLGIGAGST